MSRRRHTAPDPEPPRATHASALRDARAQYFAGDYHLAMAPELVVLLALIGSVAPTHASAQEDPGPFLYGAARLGEDSAPRAADRFATDVSVDAGAFYTDTTLQIPGATDHTTSVAGDVSVRARYDVLGIELSIPEEYGKVADYVVPPGAAFVANPSAALFGVGDFAFDGIRGTVRAGFGAAIPNTQWPEPSLFGLCGTRGCDPTADFFVERALFLAAAQSGLWQSYRYRIGSSSPSFFVPLGAEVWIHRIGYLALDLLLTTQWLERHLDVELAAAVEGGIEPSPHARFSVRVVAVGRPPDGREHTILWEMLGPRAFELSSEPRITLAFGPFFARLGVLVNLEGPWGLDGVIRGVTSFLWSARGSAGVRF
jgi:hypothetical protein